MPRTRGKAAASGAAIIRTESASSRYPMSENSHDPPQVFVMPSKASSGARVVSLPNPRTSKPSRYLACPESGLYEFTKFAAGSAEPRSWLLEVDRTPMGANNEKTLIQSQVTEEADLYVATLADPLFLSILALAVGNTGLKADSKKRMFLSLDDHFETLSESYPHLSEILRWKGVRDSLQSRMEAICDSVEAGDEAMFRLSETKLLQEIISKAKRMSETSLPPTMEHKFVKKALEAPIMSIRNAIPRQATSEDMESMEGTATPQTESGESQTSNISVDSTFSAASEVSTAATAVSHDSATADDKDEMVAALQASEHVMALQRFKVAFNFLCSRYIPVSQAAQLQAGLVEQKSSIDLTPLNEFHKKLAALRQDATNSRSLSSYSRKRPFDEDDEERAEKRRKKEDEEKHRKMAESRGVRDLKKVNVSGMKKMSDFFKKK
jgi:hypothetical protein